MLNDIILATLDVESLYTTISHARGLEALEYYLKDHIKEHLNSTSFALLEISSYKIPKRTLMGFTFGPKYANIYVFSYM